MNAEEKMETIIQLYLSGKKETQIADLLNSSESEVKVILNSKNEVYNVFGKDKWKQIQFQKKKNKQELTKALQNDFSNMSSDDLQHLINHFLMSHLSVSAYCEQYGILENVFLLYLLNSKFLNSKLGQREGSIVLLKLLATISEVVTLENPEIGTNYLNYWDMLQKYAPLYLDSLYKPKEFAERYQLTEQIFNELFTNEAALTAIGKADLYSKFQEHETKVREIRKYGNLEEGHLWIKEANVRRVLIPGIESLPKEQLEFLSILVSYYEHAGNIEMVKKEQKKTRNKITEVLLKKEMFKDIVLPSVYEKIELYSQRREMSGEPPRITGMMTMKEVDINSLGIHADCDVIVASKKNDLLRLQQAGMIRPYWICGNLAANNFATGITAIKLGISEDEVIQASDEYMKKFSIDSNGNVLPFDRAFEVLLFAASLGEENIIIPKKRA